MNYYKEYRIFVIFESGSSVTRTDLVAYHTELLVMSWDVVRSRCLVKYGELPMSCYDTESNITPVYYDIPMSIHESPPLIL